VALAVLAIVVGPKIYCDVMAAPPAEALTVSENSEEPSHTSGEALDPEALSGIWRITSPSEAGYRVDEV